MLNEDFLTVTTVCLWNTLYIEQGRLNSTSIVPGGAPGCYSPSTNRAHLIEITCIQLTAVPTCDFFSSYLPPTVLAPVVCQIITPLPFSHYCFVLLRQLASYLMKVNCCHCRWWFYFQHNSLRLANVENGLRWENNYSCFPNGRRLLFVDRIGGWSIEFHHQSGSGNTGDRPPTVGPPARTVKWACYVLSMLPSGCNGRQKWDDKASFVREIYTPL